MSELMLSICIPTYNNATWLEYSLRRILPQIGESAGRAEVIVTDNCSGDETMQVLKSLADKYPEGFRYARNESNMGHNGNYQRCIQMARGAYVWLIGTDDILRQDAVLTLIQLIGENRDLEYFYCNYSKFSPGLSPEATESLQSFPTVPTGSADVRNYRVPQIRDLAALDFNTFSPMYVNVMARELMLEAADWGMLGPLFSTLETTVSFGAFVIDQMLDKPGFYVGEPLLAASSALSWSPFAPIYATTMFPEMYRRLQKNGVSSGDLRQHRRRTLKIARDSLKFLLTHPLAKYRNQFSFARYVGEYWRFPEFWIGMLTISPALVRYWCSRHFWSWKLGRLKISD